MKNAADVTGNALIHLTEIKSLAAAYHKQSKTTRAGKQFVEDLAEVERGFEFASPDYCKVVSRLICGFLYNPLDEKSDPFYEAVRKNFSAFMEALKTEAPEVFAKCMPFGDPEKAKHPLVTALIRCVYQCSLDDSKQELLAAIFACYQFDECGTGLEVRINLVAIWGQMHLKLTAHKTAVMRLDHLKDLLRIEAIVGREGFPVELRNALNAAVEHTQLHFETKETKKKKSKVRSLKLAFVGAPKVGKSSFINKSIELNWGHSHYLTSGVIESADETAYRVTDGVVSQVKTKCLSAHRRSGTFDGTKLQVWDIEGPATAESDWRFDFVCRQKDIFLIFLDSAHKPFVHHQHLEVYTRIGKNHSPGARFFVILAKFDLAEENTEFALMEMLLSDFPEVSYLGRCSNLSSKEELQEMVRVAIKARQADNELRALLQKVEDLAKSPSLLANVSTVLFSQDLLHFDEVNLQSKTAHYLMLMSVYLSNPLAESSDSFFRSLRPLYVELCRKISKNDPSFKDMLFKAMHLPADSAFWALLPPDLRPAKAAEPSPEEFVILEDQDYLLIVTPLSKALLKCLYTSSLQTVRAMCEVYGFEFLSLLHIRVNWMHYEKRLLDVLKGFKTPPGLLPHITAMLENPIIVGTGTFSSEIKKALITAQNKCKRLLPEYPALHGAAEPTAAEPPEQAFAKLVAVQPQQLLPLILRQALAHLQWCQDPVNLAKELPKMLAADLEQQLRVPYAHNLPAAQQVFLRMNYYFTRVNPETLPPAAQELYALYLRLLISLVRYAPEFIAGWIRENKVPIREVPIEGNLCKLWPCEGIFLTAAPPYELKEPTLAEIFACYGSDAAAVAKLQSAYDAPCLAEGEYSLEALQIAAAISREVGLCVLRHSQYCDFSKILLPIDKAVRESRRVISDIAGEFAPEGNIIAEDFTGASLRQNLNLERAILMQCLTAIHRLELSRNYLWWVQDEKLQKELKPILAEYAEFVAEHQQTQRGPQ